MRRWTTTRGMKVIGLLGLGMLLLGSQPAAAREKIRQGLTAVADPNASGQVRLLLRTDSVGQFEVRVNGLDADSTYEVIVGGVKVGTLTTSGGGSGRARFRTRPRGHDLLLGFDPRGAALVVRNAAGEDVLGGTIQTGSNGDPEKSACCVPDDGGSECEDRTAAECTAQGGTVATVSSCLPNPCAGTPPVAVDVVCCVPDDSGAECEDRTMTECAAQGGVVVAATSCDPNPCAATPPTDPDIRCCLPDDSGPECEDRTADQCTAQGGVNMGPGSCTPNPCAAAPPVAQTADDHGGNGGGGKHGGDPTATSPAGDNHGGRTTYY